MNFKEIVKKLKAEEISISDFAYGEFGEGDDCYVEDIGASKEVDQYGGEDCGSTWYAVRHFPLHDVYIRVDGYYSSYNGTDFDYAEYKEVFPTEVTKIEYLTKKSK